MVGIYGISGGNILTDEFLSLLDFGEIISAYCFFLANYFFLALSDSVVLWD